MIVEVIASRTASAPCPARAGPFLTLSRPRSAILGRWSSIVNRVVRSTKVPIAEAAKSDDQVAFPVSRNSSVLGLGGPLADHDVGTYKLLASDLDNLTIADPTVNRSQKSDLDAAKWMPMRHGAWFTEWVIQVKLEYGLSVDPAERDALVGAAGGGRSSTELRWRRASTGAPTPWGTRARLGAGTAQRLWVADPIRDCSLTHDFGQRLTALSLTAGLEPSTVPSPARGRLHRARTRRSGSPYPAHDRDGLLSGTMTGAALTASEAGRCCDGNEFRALGIHDRFLDSID